MENALAALLPLTALFNASSGATLLVMAHYFHDWRKRNQLTYTAANNPAGRCTLEQLQQIGPSEVQGTV